MFDSPSSPPPPPPSAMPKCGYDADIADADFRNVRIEILDDLTEAEALWRDESDHFAHYVFQCHEWLRLSQDTLGRALGIRPCPVRVVNAEGRTLLLIPLGIRRVFFCKVLVFLGGGVSDYNAPLIARTFPTQYDASAMAWLWEAILARLPHVDVVWLPRMPEHVEGVRNPLIALPHAVEAPLASYAASPLPDSFKAFRELHKSQIFSATERKRRKAAKLGLGAVSFEVLKKAEDVHEAVEFAMSRKRQRYGDKSLPPAYQAFYRKMAHSRLAAGEPHVCRLRIGEVTVASHIGAVHKGRFYFLLPGFETGEWASLSPGNQLITDMIKWCISNEVRTFDMTVGDEE